MNWTWRRKEKTVNRCRCPREGTPAQRPNPPGRSIREARPVASYPVPGEPVAPTSAKGAHPSGPDHGHEMSLDLGGRPTDSSIAPTSSAEDVGPGGPFRWSGRSSQIPWGTMLPLKNPPFIRPPKVRIPSTPATGMSQPVRPHRLANMMYSFEAERTRAAREEKIEACGGPLVARRARARSWGILTQKAPVSTRPGPCFGRALCDATVPIPCFAHRLRHPLGTPFRIARHPSALAWPLHPPARQED